MYLISFYIYSFDGKTTKEDDLTKIETCRRITELHVNVCVVDILLALTIKLTYYPTLRFCPACRSTIRNVFLQNGRKTNVPVFTAFNTVI